MCLDVPGGAENDGGASDSSTDAENRDSDVGGVWHRTYMSFASSLREGVEGLIAHDALNVDAAGLAASVAALDDGQVRMLIGRAGALVREIGVLQAVLAGVAAGDPHGVRLGP